MTIKRRLFISNILMIVIPALIAGAISLAGIAIIWSMFQGPEHEMKDQKHVQEELVKFATKFLNDSGQEGQRQAIEKIGNILDDNDMNLIIYQNNKLLYKFGSTKSPDTKLIDAITALGGEGTVSLGSEELYAQKIFAQDNQYIIHISSIKRFNKFDDTFKDITDVAGVLLVLGILATILITNRFLTKFVFSKIQEPLDILVDGVHQIRDGNLDYRIVYNGKDEFEAVCNDFNDMAVRLKQFVTLTQKQEQSRKELLASISHDLRSPLTSIKAYTEGLLDDVAKTPESKTNYLQMIKTKAEDINRMVDKLLLFSKMDLGDYPYYPETLDLNSEIISVVNSEAEEFAFKGLDIKIGEITEGVRIYADPVQLRSVFTNILENSLKYKDKKQGYVIISTEKHEDEVHIFIEDNGPGVQQEALGKLFDVFYRSDSSRNNPDKGSGLGLAITEKAISRMGGSIYARNLEPSGLCMVIKLPILSKEQNK